MRTLLALLITLSLQAQTIWVLETNDLIGKCVIQTGDIVIKSDKVQLHAPNNITVIACNDKLCVDNTVNKYKRMYRTNGIGMETIY